MCFEIGNVQKHGNNCQQSKNKNKKGSVFVDRGKSCE